MIAGLVSQLVARRCNHENFYEQVLTQDGHQMAHVIPPRDLRSWQNLPVSAIAQFAPVVLSALDDETIDSLLARHPYQRFPVIRDGLLAGILLRAEVAQARMERRAMRLLPPVSARPGQSIRDCQALLIDSPCGLLVISDQPRGIPLAVVTLHDLLRAQAAISEREG
jgi:CIC family chloride channel protein